MRITDTNWQQKYTYNRIARTFGNRNVFRITDHLWGESTSHRWISFRKSPYCGLSFFSLTLACTSCWRNCLVADDMRRDDVCDASVMELSRKRCRTMRPPVTNREQTKDKHNLGTTSGTGLHWSNHIDLMSKPKQSKTRQNKARPDKTGWRPVTKVSPVFWKLL